MGSAHLESTQTSPASHTQAPRAPPCPHSERPPPATIWLCWEQAAVPGPGRAGTGRAPTPPHPALYPPAVAPPPSPPFGRCGSHSHPSLVQQARLKFPQKLCLSWGLEQPGKEGGGWFHQPRFQMLLAPGPPLLPRLLAGHGHCHDRALANPGRRGWVAYCLFLFPLAL